MEWYFCYPVIDSDGLSPESGSPWMTESIVEQEDGVLTCIAY